MPHQKLTIFTAHNETYYIDLRLKKFEIFSQNGYSRFGFSAICYDQEIFCIGGQNTEGNKSR